MGKKVYPQDVIDFAHKLVLQLDGMGERKYDNGKVAREIRKSFPKYKDICRQTVAYWIDKQNWKDEVSEQKAKAVDKLKKEKDKREKQAKKDREDVQAKNFSTLELAREENKKDVDLATRIMRAKAQYSLIAAEGDYSDVDEETVQKRKLTPYQESMYYSQSKSIESKHDELLAEADKFEDNVLHITFEVIPTSSDAEIAQKRKEYEEANGDS